jgi:serine/threonine protein phosphatase PrpC
MGNLLGSPVVDKETHTGEMTTTTTDPGSTSFLKWGLSSMQGWRVHMEDAHIAECNLYAVLENKGKVNNDKSSLSSSSLSSSLSSSSSQTKIIPLPGHALFACFDGHGGTFSAEYAGRNFLRILSKQPKFVEYAQALLSNEDNTNRSSNNINNNKNSMAKQSELYLLLKHALQQAFVETDYEIALAIRGDPHPHANQSYHHQYHSNIAAANTGTCNNNNNDDEDNDVVMKQSIDDHHDGTTNDDTMRDAAGRAAANHVQALDDDGDSGTTACIVLVTPYSLVCANAGDSRAIFSRKNANTILPSTAIPLSFDHKPDDEMEERRIRAAGGYVAGGRVAGDLAVSRGLGDFRFKDFRTVLNNTPLFSDASNTTSLTTSTTIDEASTQSFSDTFPAPGDQKVSPIPDIVVHARNHTMDEFIVIACDGIWDVQSNSDCIQEIHAMIQQGETNLGLICEEVRHVMRLDCIITSMIISRHLY